MTLYFIGIGSNENARENCQRMVAILAEQFGDIKVSRIIQTKAVGTEAPDYLNAVACFESDIGQDELNSWCKVQELRLGRDRKQTLCRADLDIILAVDSPGQVNPAQAEEAYFRLLIAELV